ncbi:MAG: PQQ-binding-like beta-propeller repeat protein [Acidobacteriaceae bacterium]|nr:PQQ-binding-like beta-propeller repeat protein [Acidobacteriaceae bacterium]
MFRPISRCIVILIVTGAISLLGCSRKTHPPPQIDAAALFNKKCAGCHRNDNEMRAPEPAALREMSRTSILAALNSGRMKWQGRFLSKPEKAAIVDYLGRPDVSTTASAAAFCARDLDPPPNPPVWSGWGADPRNTRFQTTSSAGLDRERVKNLKVKWAFGFPGAAATFGQPTSFAGRVFVGSEDGTVYALDAATGCIWWSFRASATVKTAVSIGNKGDTAFFGDTNGFVYALKVSDGSVVWKVHPEPHPAARITGSPLLIGTRLYVPISSGEEGAAADPHYPCCTFRGSLVALDATSGKTDWQTYTIDEVAHPTRKGPQGVQYSGPSGAAIWSSPTAELARHVLYVATGNNYSGPATPESDAVVAIDMNSGKKLWHRQFNSTDLWNSGCVAEQKDNCPEKRGDDFDFGAPPIVSRLPDGHDILLLAQKSGLVYALDPDRRGKLLWKTRIGHGGPLGGIQWGGAADRRYAYFPLSDLDDSNPLAGGGLFALDLRTGKQVWYAAPPKPACAGLFGCSAAQMAPPSALPGVIFSGSLDGHLRAYDTRDGSVIWDFDTSQEFRTTNGVKAHGGSMNGSGPAIVSGMLYVNTGYTNAMAGNVLLAFSAQ